MVQPTVQPTLSHWSTSARCPANATAWHALASSCYGRQSAPRGQTARQNANGIRLKRQRKLLLQSLNLMMLRGVTIGVLRYVCHKSKEFWTEQAKQVVQTDEWQALHMLKEDVEEDEEDEEDVALQAALGEVKALKEEGAKEDAGLQAALEEAKALKEVKK